MSKPIILIFASYYLPGFKAGGPIRSIENIIGHFSNDYDFKIITSDRDLGDEVPYQGIVRRKWAKVGNVSVYYIARNDCSINAIMTAINEASPDIIYFNSFFDPAFTIVPLLARRLGLLSRKASFIIAPRGEFAAGALALKALKKKIFLFVAKFFGLYGGLIWQATSQHELEDIKRWAGKDANVHIVSNLPPVFGAVSASRVKKLKNKGSLRVVCVARVARNKNIDGALRILQGVKANVEFNIYGPCEDKVYWQECSDIIANLPANVSVKYHGQIQHELIKSALAEYDLFFLPTHGENFGHVILEAFSAGLPVLISDLTPWKGLQAKGVGWDLSLDDPEQFRFALNECADMNETQYSEIVENVYRLVSGVLNDAAAIESNKRLFNSVIIDN